MNLQETNLGNNRRLDHDWRINVGIDLRRIQQLNPIIATQWKKTEQTLARTFKGRRNVAHRVQRCTRGYRGKERKRTHRRLGALGLALERWPRTGEAVTLHLESHYW